MASQPDLVALFECPICFEAYRDPRILTCGHQFCKDCLTPLAKGSPPGITCPSCRGRTRLGSGGVTALARPVLMNEIQEKLSELTLTPEPCPSPGPHSSLPSEAEQLMTSHTGNDVTGWLCNGCQKPAVYYCYQCQKRLCGACREKHDRVAKFYCHRVVTILPGLFCAAHSGDAVTEYCHDCKTGICSTCLMDTHSDHNTADLLTLAELTRDQLLKFVEKFQNRLCPAGPETLGALESTIQSVHSRRQKFQDKMKQISEALREFVNVLGKTAAELDTRVDDDLEKLSMVTSLLIDSEAGIAATRREIASARWLLSATTDAELVRGSTDLLARAGALRDIPDMPKSVTVHKPQIQDEFWTLADSLKSLIGNVPVSYKKETIDIIQEKVGDIPEEALNYDVEALKREVSQLVSGPLLQTVANETDLSLTSETGGNAQGQNQGQNKGRERLNTGVGGDRGAAAAMLLMDDNESSMSATEGGVDPGDGAPNSAVSKRTAKRKRQRARKKAQAANAHVHGADAGAGASGSGSPTCSRPPLPPSPGVSLDGASGGAGAPDVIPAPGPGYYTKMADFRTQVTNFCLDRKHERVVVRVGAWRAPLRIYSYSGQLVHEIVDVHIYLGISIDRGMCVDTKRDFYVFATEFDDGSLVRIKWNAVRDLKDFVKTQEPIMDVAYSDVTDKYYVTQLTGREIVVYNAQHLVVEQRITPDIDPTDFPIDLGHGFPFYISTGLLKSRPVLLVNDYHDGSVCVLDATRQGQLITRHGEYGMDAHELINPMTSAVDHAGRVVIVDNGNSRLVAHWSDARGQQHQRCLMTEEVCKRDMRTKSPPSAIDIDPVNKVMGLTFSEYDKECPNTMRLILFKLE